MTSPLTAPQILDREFLEIRAKILEIAAAFDRLDRADDAVADDRRMRLVQQALEILASDRDTRAEEVQLLFSREYDEAWRKKFGL